MKIISLFDFIAFFSLICAIIFIFRGWKHERFPDARLIFLLLLIITAITSFSNLLEWSGISSSLDNFEDFVEIIEPILWFIFFYTLLQTLTREKIESSEKRYRLLFERAGEAIFIVDTKTGRYLDANQAAATLTGRTISEIQKLTTHDLTPSGSHERLDQLSTATNRLEFNEVTYLRPDGTQRTAFLSSVPIEDDQVFGIAHDITEQKEAEEAVQRINEELEQLVLERTAKLEATNEELQSFSYSVSHDLRAPLRAINGFSSILQEEFGNVLGAQGKEYLNKIITSSQKMNDLIQGMLTLSRLGRKNLQLQEIDMTHMANKVFEKLIALEPKREIKFIALKNKKVTTDIQLMEILVTNLISNAIKFTRDCSDAVIEFGCTDQTEHGQAFFVKDNGIGFEMKYADKLFTPFQRLHSPEKYEGTGVGLAIVKRIVQRFNGKIWVEAGPDQGACFYFTVDITDIC